MEMIRQFQHGAIHRDPPADTPQFASLSLFRDAPVPRAAVNYHASIDLSDRDALGNDQLLNCVPCAALRALQLRRATLWGDTWRPTRALSVSLYSQWTGYPLHDAGTDTVHACTQRVNQGMRIADNVLDIGPWFVIDPRNVDHVKLAIQTARAVEFNLALPMSATDVTKPWDIVPGSPRDGCHRVVSGRYDPTYLWLITWGFEQAITWDAYLAWVLAADVVLSLECLPTWADRGEMESAMRALAA